MPDRPGSPFLTVPLFERIPGLVHGFGTAAWTQPAFVRWAARRGFRPVIMDQVHSDAVHVLESAPPRKLRGDGLVTAAPGLLAVVRTADCLPVLLVDRPARVVAAVHCGWRGTVRRVLARAVEAMAAAGADPGRVRAALGPCIGRECYEVGAEVRAEFADAGFPGAAFGPVRGRRGKSRLDLRAANAFVLAEAGVRPDRVLSLEACTRCDPGLHSFRRDRSETARMVNFIGWRS